MKSLMLTIFGSYTPITYPTYLPDGSFDTNVVASGLAGCDWEYIGGVFLFGVVLYCTLRIIEAVIRSL